MNLIEAIESLDPSDDAHWTKDGRPDLNVLKELTGGAVKRADVDAAKPGFTREAAQPSEPAEATGRDFVSELDSIFSDIGENERLTLGALYRMKLFYKGERQNIIAQQGADRARRRI